jgi:hypoxanthine phosphoribosyltransferase
METLKIHDRKFSESINSHTIQSAVEKIAHELNHDLMYQDVVFVAVLNGAFMFTSDLIKQIKLNCRISFLKIASYEGVESSGTPKELIGINEVLKDKVLVVVEDIVDTGNTLNLILKHLHQHQPAEIKVVTLLFKPDSFEYNFKLDYVGFRIPSEFVVGYGLDYNGLGRNLNSIYTLAEEL